MPNPPQRVGATAGLARCGLLLAGAALLAACTGPLPEAHLPVSGISGMNGGAADTIYYDRDANPHFQG